MGKSIKKLFKSIRHNKILDLSKLKAFADDNLNVAQMMKFVFNPLPDDKILDWSKLKQIADDILKCI